LNARCSAAPGPYGEILSAAPEDLCALVPVPGSSFMDQLATEDMLDLGYVAGLSAPDSEGRRGWLDEGLARDFMYADCDPEATKPAVAPGCGGRPKRPTPAGVRWTPYQGRRRPRRL
jgi:hypothetical protein